MLQQLLQRWPKSPYKSKWRIAEQAPFEPAGPDSTIEPDRLHVSLRLPGAMISFTLLGIAFILTHHFYYDSLNGNPIVGDTYNSQEWSVRIGTGLAFLAKACLIASVSMSYQQHYWRLLRSRSMSVGGIDDIMGLLTSPLCFFNWEVIRKAWSSALVALVIWFVVHIFDDAELTFQGPYLCPPLPPQRASRPSFQGVRGLS